MIGWTVGQTKPNQFMNLLTVDRRQEGADIHADITYHYIRYIPPECVDEIIFRKVFLFQWKDINKK